MITVPELAANALDTFIASHMKHRFGSIQAGLIERTSSAARVALECIGNSDALYHNVEHTMLVTLVGYDIMNGPALLKHTSAGDYARVIVACLLHDIGYVRGILKGDEPGGYMVDANGGKANLRAARPMPPCCLITLIARKLYVLDRLAGNDLFDADNCACHRIHALSSARRARNSTRRRRAVGACRRPYRTTRRSALSAQGERAVLRI